MLALNIKHRQPLAALWYTSIGTTLLSLVILYLGFALATSAALDGAGTPHLGAALFILTLGIAVVTAMYPILSYLLFSYELTDRVITINSGILFRQHETINFGSVQVIDNEREPVLMLFGLTLVKIWTASPDQVSTTSGVIRPIPDAVLLLKKDTAQQLKDFITHRPTGTN